VEIVEFPALKTLLTAAAVMPIASLGGYDSHYQNGQRQDDLSDQSAPPEHVFSPRYLAVPEHVVRT
jgi:hypothetical protein